MAGAGTSPRYWRAIVGAIIVLVVIVGVAALVAFRERDDDSATATTTTVPLSSEWFGARTPEACPQAVRSFGAIISAVVAVQSDQPWPEARAVPLGANRDARKAYRALVALGTEQAQTELRFLVRELAGWQDLIEASTSVPDYLRRQDDAVNDRVSENVISVLELAARCNQAQQGPPS